MGVKLHVFNSCLRPKYSEGQVLGLPASVLYLLGGNNDTMQLLTAASVVLTILCAKVTTNNNFKT